MADPEPGQTVKGGAGPIGGGAYTVSPVIHIKETAGSVSVGLGVTVHDGHDNAVAGQTRCTGESPNLR